jgi:hypothetical protein
MTVAETLNHLASSFTGQLLQPLDLAYENARKVHNGLVDKHPAVIARCHGVADVVGAVRLARTTNLEVAVRGGGHNVAGRATYWKAHFLSDLSDESIRTIVGCFERCPSPMSQIVIEHFHGAATRVGITDTACTLRTAGFNVVLISQWSDPRDTDACTAWCRDTYKALQPFLGTTRYVNYLGDDEPGDPAATVYGPNLARLRELKTKYDPDNFFHTNVNIRPRR